MIEFEECALINTSNLSTGSPDNISNTSGEGTGKQSGLNGDKVGKSLREGNKKDKRSGSLNTQRTKSLLNLFISSSNNGRSYLYLTLSSLPHNGDSARPQILYMFFSNGS